MCIVAIAWKVINNMPLCLISNRDEFYQRPTRGLHTWQESKIIAGQDLAAGGTWLGISKTGRWAVITNFRDGHDTKTYALSRGKIMTDFLNGELAPIRFAKQLERTQQDYAGFNLLVGNREQAVYMSNRGDAPEVLSAGVYVLSNTTMGQFWHKTQHMRTRFTQELLPVIVQEKQDEQQLEDIVWDILQDERKLRAEQLPRTGISFELEHLLSSSFIKSEHYGTRSSNFLRLYQNQAFWIEKQHATPQKITRLDVPFGVKVEA